ncbi:hypothetical protein [Staphylococcus sp. GDY8P85P]|uniref:hypothetical protein n=1 Tax=Staphylococcus sp. GDY8P85P TaxID=2804138 RepID=UPI000E484544|nr:hypothetical protein [Staphylococcus sp. GDY8P85P]
MIRIYENYGKTDIFVVNQERVKELISKLETRFYKNDLNRFICKEDDIWLAIDNSTADVFIEEYDSLEEAFQYLLIDDEFSLTEIEEKEISNWICNYETKSKICSLIGYNV